MAEFPFLPLWTKDLITDTDRLTPAEFAAYVRLLCAAWADRDCSLPNNDAQLGRLAKDVLHWSRIKSNVMAFWKLGEDDRWRNGRLTDVRNEVRKTSEANRAKAVKRWGMVGDSKPTAGLKSRPDQKRNIEPSSKANSLKSFNGEHAGALPQDMLEQSPSNAAAMLTKTKTIYKDAGREGRKWISVTQAEWKTGAARWRKEKGCDPPLDADGGWWFPPDWLEGARS